MNFSGINKSDKSFRIKEMFEDKDDVRHLFMCQTAIATSDGHGSTLNVVVYFFVCFLDLFTKFVTTKN